jgi:dTDP-4-dehydrorhamnose 3,5-epimerase
MKLNNSELPEIKMVENSVYLDNRGQIAKFDLPENEVFNLILISRNNLAGTLRGLHFQKPPYGEVKVVTCTKGEMMDYVVDVRTDSPSYGKWTQYLLSSSNPYSLIIPKGFAHGFQTLQPETEVLYTISGKFSPSHSITIDFKDPDLDIELPMEISVIADKDVAGISFSQLSNLRIDWK